MALLAWDAGKHSVKIKEIDRQHPDQTRVTMDTLKFLRDWLTNHIMRSDQKYVEFLVAKGVS
jgi:hemerythrin